MDDIDDDYIFSDPRCNWIAVESDPEAAAHILTVAAEYLRECQGKGFPADLAGYLAKAFETAVAQEPKKRLAALGRALHLTAGHKRPTSKVSWCDVGHEVGRSSAVTACLRTRRWITYPRSTTFHSGLPSEC